MVKRQKLRYILPSLAFLAGLLFLAACSAASTADSSSASIDYSHAQEVWVIFGSEDDSHGIEVADPEETRPGFWKGKSGRHTADAQTLTLNVNDSFAFDGNAQRLDLEITYLDSGKDKLNIEADRFVEDARDGRYSWHTGVLLIKTGTSEWKTYRVPLHDCRFANRQGRDYSMEGGIGDLRIHARDNGPETLHKVRLSVPYLQARTAAPGNVFGLGEPVLVEVQVANRGIETLDGTLRYAIQGPGGEFLDQGEEKVLCPSGLNTVHVLRASPERLGPYSVELSLLNTEGQVLGEQTVYGGVGVPPLKPNPESPFAVGALLGRNWGRESEAQLIAQSGVAWVRQGLRQDRIERQEGEYTWSLVDQGLNAAESAGLRVMGSFLGGTRWAQPSDGTAESGKAFVRFVEAAVSRYGDRIAAWEIWNEPDLEAFWSPINPTRYAATLRAAAQTLRRHQPETLIVSGGLARGNFWFLDKLYKENALQSLVDVIGLHPYVKRPEKQGKEPGVIQRIKQAELWTERAGDASRPFWLTELGWSTGELHRDIGKTLDEPTQAAFLVRTFVLALSRPQVERIFWFNFRDFGDLPESPAQSWGIVRFDLSAKPAYLALRNLATQLKDSNWEALDRSNASMRAYEFRGSVRNVWVVWAPEGPATVKLPFGPGPVRVIDLMGNEEILNSEKDFLMGEIGPEPVFLISGDVQ
ncbi:MAG: hypothetical protein JW937_04030 [Candidatus Omnitrophica bacterium]|nr:hypothetical protein [Candidatus Omnitrophota bacterium]